MLFPVSPHHPTGAPLRLKVAGAARLNGRVVPGASSALRHPNADATPLGEGSRFESTLHLDGMRVNQLNLTRNLAGTLDAASEGVRVSARGTRPDEVLDLALPWPLFGTAGAGSEEPQGAPEGGRWLMGPLQGEGPSLLQALLETQGAISGRCCSAEGGVPSWMWSALPLVDDNSLQQCCSNGQIRCGYSTESNMRVATDPSWCMHKLVVV